MGVFGEFLKPAEADPQALASALAGHQASLEGRIRQFGAMAERVRDLCPPSAR